MFWSIISIFQDGSADLDSLSGGEGDSIEPLPGLETILEELQQEDGYVCKLFENFNYLKYWQSESESQQLKFIQKRSWA